MVSKTDVKRYALIGLCVCSLILVFLPLFEIDAFFVDYSVSTWNIVRQAFGEDVDLEGADLIAVLCAVCLMVIPLVHLLKLTGAFGKSFKDSKIGSILLSVGQLAAILGFSYFLVFFDNDFDDFEMNLLVSLLTPWFYIWFVAIVVMIVLSCTLGEGEYSLAAGTSVPTQNGVFCPSCGAMNSSASGFCSKCGATLSNQEAPIVCSNCGRKLTATDAFCPGCGTARK